MKRKIGIIGYGEIGQSIINGFIADNKFYNRNLIVCDKNGEKLNELKLKNIKVTSDPKVLTKGANILIFAITKKNTIEVLDQIKNEIKIEKQILVFLTNGIKISEIYEVIPSSLIFRILPNTASEIQESISCICSNCSNSYTREEVFNLFQILGKMIYIDEAMIEQASTLNACGLAFVYRFMRAMILGSVQIGLDSNSSEKIVAQIVKAAAEKIITETTHCELEIDSICSPRGYTIEGLNEMESFGFSNSVIRGIKASYLKLEKEFQGLENKQDIFPNHLKF